MLCALSLNAIYEYWLAYLLALLLFYHNFTGPALMLSKHLNVMKSHTDPACPVCITFWAIALLLCLKYIFLFRTYIKY